MWDPVRIVVLFLCVYLEQEKGGKLDGNTVSHSDTRISSSTQTNAHYIKLLLNFIVAHGSTLIVASMSTLTF